MKNTKHFFLLFALLFTARFSQAQITNPDTMVYRIFATLKAKDDNAFVALYPNQEQMMKLISRMLGGLAASLAKVDTSAVNKIDTAHKGEMDFVQLQQYLAEELKKKMTPQELAKQYEKVRVDFKKFIADGEKQGVVWSKANLVRYHYDTTVAAGDAEAAQMGLGDTKRMKGTMYISAGSKTFSLPFGDVVLLSEDGGWYGVKLKGLQKQAVPANTKKSPSAAARLQQKVSLKKSTP